MTVATAPPGEWTGWCDGSAVPNPGKMGIGGVLRGPDETEHVFSLPLGRTGCNNEAEACALLEMLRFAQRLGVRSLLIWSDSDVVVRLAGDERSTEARRLAPVFAEIRAAMQAFDAVALRWLPQHRNQQADSLSRQALGLSPRVPATSQKKRRKR